MNEQHTKLIYSFILHKSILVTRSKAFEILFKVDDSTELEKVLNILLNSNNLIDKGSQIQKPPNNNEDNAIFQYIITKLMNNRIAEVVLKFNDEDNIYLFL